MHPEPHAANGNQSSTPLSRVHENTLKLVVGIMLTTFGVFGEPKAPP
jgi:hypothetical protein